MAINSLTQLTGSIVVPDLGTGICFPDGLSIELLTQTTSPPSWLGSASIDSSGNFTLYTSFKLSGTSEAICNIYRNAELVWQGMADVNNNVVLVLMEKADYINITRYDEDCCCFNLGGVLSLGAKNVTGVPVVTNNVVIKLNVAAFRNPVAIAQTTLNSYGKYCFSIPYSLIKNAGSPPITSPIGCCDRDRTPMVFITLEIGGVIALKTDSFAPVNECLEKNLHIDDQHYFTAFVTELEAITNDITSVTGLPSSQFYSITDDEVKEISSLSDLSISTISLLINAYEITNSTGIIVSHAYALSKAKGPDLAEWLEIDLGTLTDLINDAINDAIIPSGGDINNTYQILLSKKGDYIGAIPTDNGDTMLATISSITKSPDDAKIFLQLNSEYGSLSPDEFWQQVESTLPGQSGTLQQGLQVLSITGMQPEISGQLMSVIEGRQPSPPSMISANFLSLYSRDDWQNLINDVSTQNNKLCVPQAIIDIATIKGTDPKTEYANKLFAVTNDLFATTVINNQIQSDPDFASYFGGHSATVNKFLTQNPNFDFRLNNVWDIVPESIPNLTQVRPLIAPLQNVMRLISGKPQAVIAMVKNGIRSSADIAAIPVETFVAQYAEILSYDLPEAPGTIAPTAGFSTEATLLAQQVYNKAVNTALKVNTTHASFAFDFYSFPGDTIYTSFNKGFVDSFINTPPSDVQSPDLTSLFGNLSTCTCSDCMSMYSPGAYFTDILNFIQTQVGTSTGNNTTNAYDELNRRRPDLWNIDLSCDNANTPLPYTDLINEMLERRILHFSNSSISVTTSYQTSETADELAAYPEHTIKTGTIPDTSYETDASYQEVYNTILKFAFYPNTVPFNLPLEESRTYLQHLGYSRYDLMQKYKPKDTVYNDPQALTHPTSPQITAYTSAAEWVNVSKFEADIISNTATINDSDTILPPPDSNLIKDNLWQCYGFETKEDAVNNYWYNVLFNNNVTAPAPASLNTLLENAGITYTELLQILNTNFLNPVLPSQKRQFVIISNAIVQDTVTGDWLNEDTCNLDQLTILYSGDIPATPGTPLPAPNTATINSYILPFFDKLHRFTRLLRATGWSIYKLDIMLQSLQADDIDAQVFRSISDIDRVAQLLNVEAELLCAFWSDISTSNYIDYNDSSQSLLPSVYENLFLNKAVLNPPDPQFEDPDFPGAPGYVDHKGTILAAANNISENELDVLYDFVSPGSSVLTLQTLSRVYALSVVARGLRISIQDLITKVFTLCSIDIGIFSGTAAEQLSHLQNIITGYQKLSDVNFSLDETNYLLRHSDPLGAYGPPLSSIQLFYETLRSDLKKQYDKDGNSLNINNLGNIVIREFCTSFNIDGTVAQDLLQHKIATPLIDGNTSTAIQDNILNVPVTTITDQGTTVIETPLYDVLTDILFINSTNNIALTVSNSTISYTDDDDITHSINIIDLYNSYVVTSKIAFIIGRLNISADEFNAFLMGSIETTITDAENNILPPPPPNPVASPDLRLIFKFPMLANLPVIAIDGDLPVPSDPPADPPVYLDHFLNLSEWTQLRNRLNLVPNDFINLLTQLNTDPGTLPYSATPQQAISNYISVLTGITEWDSTTLDYLLVTPLPGTTLPLLGVSNASVDDFLQASLLWQVSDIFDSIKRLGLSPQITYPALRADILLAASQPVRQAAKAKYTDTQWTAIAKPLQDVLREKQRQALVAYAVAHPDMGDPAESALRWKDSNGLFAYYLIDVEVKPAMLTTRLKQAISSLQLYMMRVIQNLENSNGSTDAHISIGSTQITQWENWRKWYRVWEANREVFLYPENWMEPTLRDDKTTIFKELETQLQQNEVTNDTAEDALMTYLNSLDKISKLEPVTAYHQLEKDSAGNITVDIKHVFSRNNSEPQTIHYRRLENNRWSPWEKVNLDIKSDHITAIVWHRRLYLFWLTFTAKQTKRPYGTTDATSPGIHIPDNAPLWVNMIKNVNDLSGVRIMNIETDENQDDKQTTWDIKLNWSQYKDGTWLSTEMCDDVMNIAPSMIGLTSMELASFNSYISTNGQDDALRYSFIAPLSNNGELKLADLFKNRLYLSAYFHNSSEDQPLILSLVFYARPDDAGAMNMYSFIFPDPVSKPYVERGQERVNTLLSPIGTQANSMKFREVTAGNQSTNNKVIVENVTTFLDQHWLYWYGWYKPGNAAPPANLPPGVAYYPRRKYNTGGITLLNGMPNGYGDFRLTKFANAYGGDNYSVIRDYFFFEDDINVYYIQKNSTQLQQAVATLLSDDLTSITTKNIKPGTAQQAASGNYAPFDSLTFNVDQSTTTFSLAGAKPASYPSATISKGSGFLSFENSSDKNLQIETPVSQQYTFLLDTYTFQTFYHAQIHQFMKALNREGVAGLLQMSNQKQTDSMNFSYNYQPTENVDSNYPTNKVQFASTEPYAIYNWEVFFHIPMLIAAYLSNNQQFEDAQKWYHYIFDPTSSTDGMTGQLSGDVKRFWKFYPFYSIAAAAPETLNDLLAAINDIANNNDADNQVSAMQNDPFNPFVIARMRNLAFMKNVVMQYLDNLIAWGDQLFTQNTIESINEATQVYILAANILGPKPESIPPRAASSIYTYQELLEAANNNLGPLSDPMVNIESFFGPNAGIVSSSISQAPNTTTAVPIYGKMLYFGVPSNDVMLGYWDTIADRLFKIRNSLNIQGIAQQLPIYEPPINPALLVKAAAMGVDIASVVSSIQTNAAVASNYRFTYLLQKANEFCAEVRSLGAALLSALEKKDAEALALLRSSQEVSMLNLVTAIKQKQVDEAQAGLDALVLTKEVTQLRYDYYSSRPFTNSYEQVHLASVTAGMVIQAIQAGLESSSSVAHSFPTVHAQAVASGVSAGGPNVGNSLKGASAALGVAAAINNGIGSLAYTMGGYQRRSDDWSFQTRSAAKELDQLDQQILGAQIRLELANKELSNHLKQVDDAQAVDDFMRNKFTNQELYAWMSNQVAATYFQSYQVAYDLARKADACYKNELPVSTKYPAGGFISFGYWDSLRKGLLAGENLQMDLRRMEAAYLEDNVRELELTKHFSLAIFSPEQLIELKTTGSCMLTIDEAWFDLDFPGHYLRRIKSVSISIPCVAGPYTTINCTLRQNKSKYRKSTTIFSGDDGYHEIENDERFQYLNNATQLIATSSAQNDSGVFELNFRDERYLPFENTGAISQWTLEFTSDIRQFDLNTISDVILHMKFTAREANDGGNLKDKANEYVSGLINNTSSSKLPRYFSLKHEFSNEWYAGFNSTTDNEGHIPGTTGHTFGLILKQSQFPEYCKGKTITIGTANAYSVYVIFRSPQPENVNIHLKPRDGTMVTLSADGQYIEYRSDSVVVGSQIQITDIDPTSPNFGFTLYRDGSETDAIGGEELVDIFFVLNYQL